MPPAAEKKTKNCYVNVSTTQQAQTVGNARRTIRGGLGVQAHIFPFLRARQISVSTCAQQNCHGSDDTFWPLALWGKKNDPKRAHQPNSKHPKTL